MGCLPRDDRYADDRKTHESSNQIRRLSSAGLKTEDLIRRDCDFHLRAMSACVRVEDRRPDQKGLRRNDA